MQPQRFVVMGAGEVGFHLARSLSAEGHHITVVELDPARQARVAEELDVRLVPGNGAHTWTLEEAGVSRCDLFMAVSSADEANLAASVLARHLGAARSVVRVKAAEEVIVHRRVYEDLFRADLLLSTQLLTTTQILNEIRGHATMAVEYLAHGKVQLRKIHLDAASPLIQKPLRDLALPADSLVVAFFRGDDLIIPSGDDKAHAGDDALILGTAEAITRTERMVSRARDIIGRVVIAGGGVTGHNVARALESLDARVQIIEKERARAEALAVEFPRFEVIHGDATDVALLRSERIAMARTFVALSGHDESNLMACLLAQELGVPQVLPIVHRAETSRLWKKMGLERVFSPRALAYERIREYIRSGYSANIVSLQRGAAQVVERTLVPAAPTAGATLAEIAPPRGLIVGAVVRGDKVFVPRGPDRLEAGDVVLLFVQQKEMDTLNLLFPGREETGKAAR